MAEVHKTETHSGPAKTAKRDRATDVLRGLTSIGMYLVNTRSPGGPDFLQHAGFHGPVTFADVRYLYALERRGTC